VRRPATLALILVLAACKRPPERQPTETSSRPAASSADAAPAVAPAPLEGAGDAARGKELAEAFECGRCHRTRFDHDAGVFGRGQQDKDCTLCHEWVAEGARHDDSQPPPTTLAGWQRSVRRLQDVPTLTGSGRYRRAWLERFLVEPEDLRPNLAPTMPRLAITPGQARDIVAWLASLSALDGGAPAASPDVLAGADAARGRRLVEQQSCGSCHAFTGVPPLPAQPPSGADPPRAVALAPDLRFVRARLDPGDLLVWLRNPASIRPRTDMPKPSLSAEEARDVAAYLLQAELAPPAPRAIPARLPLLERRVGFDEVDRKVFHKICRHCHGEPDLALGDGGPGNTGGFGFAPRGLSLSEYEAVCAGSLDELGHRRSIFAPTSDGTPRLVRALLARQREEAGKPDPEMRGMPLGLPSLPPEDIQVVETWVAQQHPR
jgi:mono/diheme cytochrome c family protein